MHSNSKYRLLVVDDDELIRMSLPMAAPESWEVQSYSHPKEIRFNESYHAAMVDMHYGDLRNAEGIDLIEKLHEKFPHLEIIAMSGDLNRDLMERALKAGASRFLAKALNPEEVKLTLNKIESYFLLQKATYRSQLSSVNWIGQSLKSLEVKKQIANLKGEKGVILIEGETGTGKEVTAQLLHQQNSEGPLIAVNIAAIPENLFESEMFGHVKGAFTGADQNKMGLIEAASEGTLFIDEIEALSLPLQVKLLRFLESGEVKRVGGKQNIQVSCLILMATNKNLEEMVRQGQFREDLLWRINGKKIVLPPLRERKEDLSLLCKYFFEQDKIRQKSLSTDALESLMEYSWPGNVRELKRVCEQLMIRSPLPIIRKEDVQGLLKPQFSVSPIQSFEKIDYSQGLQNLVHNFEAKLIDGALKENNGDIDEVAKLLDISRSSLYKKIKDYNLDRN